jgi:hypothetical protein
MLGNFMLLSLITRGDSFNVGRCHDLGESFAMMAVLGVNLEAVIDDLEHLWFGVHPRQFPGQLGMAAEFAPELHPISIGTP